MITNHLLEEKYRVQEQLAKEAEHDIRKYMENIKKIAEETEKRCGVKFQYYTDER